MHIVDHIFILLLFVVQPIHGYFSYKRYLRRLAAGETSNRVKLYRETMLLEWVAFAVVAVAWITLGRPSADLGFVASTSMQVWIGSAFTALVTAYLLYSWRESNKLSDDEKATQIDALGDLIHFLPHDNRDYRSFVAVSMTAGIVEEFLYRAFAFWYLAHFMPMWAVIVVSSSAFGLGHSYQGVGGMIRVTLIGLAFGAFYFFTGSIWLPMLAHAILDILQGALLVELMQRRGDKPLEQHPGHC
jgi:hypothetical protein